MRRTGTGAGGGVGMNKNVSPKLKTGGPNQAMSPCAVARQGSMVAPGTTDEKLVAGKALSPKLGNELCTNVGKGGPGTGRVTRKSGAQGHH